MEQKKQSTFEKLSAINVNDHVEKKSNLTYLSWAWAWSETKKACPDATYKILETEFDEALGFMCHTTVTIEGETLEMWLPVMDGANKSMRKVPYTYMTKYGEKAVEAATTFDINKTIMRCLVKNLAMFGMGIYIYAGEDLPESESAGATKSVAPKAATAPKAPAKAATPPTAGAPAAPAVGPELQELKKGTANWDNVVKYVTDNKDKGVEAIGKQLVRKYKISPALKKEIATLINS
jgi:hypothetical protein